MRTESPLGTEGGVTVSHIRLRSPLPLAFPERPRGLDELNYLRYRPAHGPAAPADADAVLVMHPGTWAGAQSLDRLARNVIRGAAATGLTIEWWSLARRSDGATDLTGVHAAYAAADPSVAMDYYFGGKPVNGRLFEGFRGGDRQRYLGELGLRQVVDDTHEVLTRELPDPVVRRNKVFLGGHSLGGLLAGAYAAWDFDGTPGHDLCAGLIAIDTLVGTDPLDLHRRRRLRPVTQALHRGVVAAVRRGLLPAATPPGGTAVAQFWTFLHILGVAAACSPDTETDVFQRLPRTAGWEGLLRALGARRYRDLLRRTTSVRDLRVTGQAALGLTVGDHHLPIDPLTSSMGTLDGPTTPRRTFPVPSAARRIPFLHRTIRAVVGTPTTVPALREALYRWRPGGPADITDLAQTLAAGPLSTFETYFPMRIHYDLWTALAGARNHDLSNHLHAATAAHLPTLHILSDPDTFVSHALKLTGLLPAGAIHAPGYRHIDMVTGADRPGEPVTAAFTQFLAQQVIPTATAERHA